MSALSRLLDWFDAPRFCSVDGQPIKVNEITAFDARTGQPHSTWTWSCPDVYLETEDGSLRHAEQRGSDFIHPFGLGRPRWHRAGSTVQSGEGE